MNRYKTVLVDPPWAYPRPPRTQSRTVGEWSGQVHDRERPYSAMTIVEICGLPVSAIAHEDCRVFLWATNRHLPHAFSVLRAWGFEYRQTLVWQKPDAFLGSVAPNAEFLLVGVRGQPIVAGRLPSAVVVHPQPKRHSQKPDVFIDLIEQCSNGPYVELFARSHRLGWDVWGNESANTATLEPSA